ncbi:MAG: YciI family protein [Proteobacteria bacterium]|nr:YciI family protein [Pseudomonadota bacterium]
MQYMLLCCFDESRWSGLSENQRAEIMQAYEEWVEDHVASGHYLAGGKLDESNKATTLRVQDARPVLKDGPFSEAKEQIGGFHVIECRDRKEAVAIAQKIPTLPAGGTVEIRPLLRSTG